jgi:hypothetical protein
MTHFINLMREARETAMSMERIRPSDELAQELIEKVINPIIRTAVFISVEEGGRLRNDIVSSIGNESFKIIDDAVKRSLERVAERLKNESAEPLSLLGDILKSEKTRKAPQRAPTMGDTPVN